jgi:hypothetical protein
MKHAPHDFGGRKADAIHATDEAIPAIEFRAWLSRARRPGRPAVETA